jgi:O-antigen ligase
VLGLATFAVLDTEALLELLGKDSTLTGRTSIWDATWRAIGERPLLGHGYSAFWNEASPTVQLIWIAVGWETPNAHSGFLEILLQLGWVGLGLVVLLAAGTLGMALLALVRGPRGAGLWVLLVLGLMGIVGRTESTLLNPDLLMLFWMAAWLAVGSRPENPASRMHRCFEGGIR